MKYINSIDKFLNIFSSSLYDKIVKESIIRIKNNITKEEYKLILKELYYELNNFEYIPSNLKEKVFLYKTNDVARIIPIMSIKDEIVYYFVCKMIEDEIAVNRTEGTFGGWRLGNKIRIQEDAEIEYVYKSYNSSLWNKNWVAFQNIINNQLTHNADNNTIVIKLDIANYYDNINLNLLEKKLLSTVKSDKLEYINILIYFLKNWNRQNDKYHSKTVGIPQNEFGDQSRLLANFYLQNYDKEIKRICDKNNAKYIRYADDQIIISNNSKKIAEIMYVICRELNNIGLNLNASKVKYYNKETTKILYGIPIYNLIDEKKYDEACSKFLQYYDNKEMDFNYVSSLKKFLNIGLNKFNIANRNRIKAIITDKKFIRESNAYYMNKIYNNLSKEEQEEYISIIYSISEESTYNGFHYELINFLSKIKKEEKIEDIKRRIEEIKNI